MKNWQSWVSKICLGDWQVPLSIVVRDCQVRHIRIFEDVLSIGRESKKF